MKYKFYLIIKKFIMPAMFILGLPLILLGLSPIILSYVFMTRFFEKESYYYEYGYILGKDFLKNKKE